MQNLQRAEQGADRRAAATLFLDASRRTSITKAAHMAYLLLLNGEAPELKDIIGQMRAALLHEAPTTIERDTACLLRAENWRFHNIACVALLSGPKSSALLAELWSAIARGSWSSPQLVATAALLDTNFDENALLLIASQTTHYKSIVSLVAMLRQGGTAGELPPESRANLQQAQSLDTDGSAEITLDRFRHLGEAASAA